MEWEWKLMDMCSMSIGSCISSDVTLLSNMNTAKSVCLCTLAYTLKSLM